MVLTVKFNGENGTPHMYRLEFLLLVQIMLLKSNNPNYIINKEKCMYSCYTQFS